MLARLWDMAESCYAIVEDQADKLKILGQHSNQAPSWHYIDTASIGPYVGLVLARSLSREYEE